ncbi:MAG: class I SAM-dependent methyltransferase [Halieaceae bacterium]|nr:class I SAM-dependent methyltransferase [Halieaceae bacterium]
MENPSSRDWYYKIEMSPGVFTDGSDRPTIGPVRALYKDVSFDGLNCLDVGTMEGIMPSLMKRAGAKEVTATDWIDSSAKIEQVKKALDVDFTYHPKLTIPSLPSALGRTFDLVNFSGVLYHTLNPLGSLATVRSLCRLGGLMLVETRTLHRTDIAMILNPPEISPRRGSYFYFTTAGLDHCLRLVGLKPIAFTYAGSVNEGYQQRVAVLCQSVLPSEAIDTPANAEWVSQARLKADLVRECQLDFETLSTGAPALDSPVFQSGGIPLEGRGLYEAMSDSSQYKVQADDKVVRLGAGF